MTASLSIIAAMDKNGVIGCDNHLPWSIKEDMRYFRDITLGHPVIMGSKTRLSLGKPLAGRTNIVLSKNPAFQISGSIVLPSPQAVISAYGNQDCFVIGGAQIYSAFIPWVDKLYITKIDHAFTGNTYFPDIDWSSWSLNSQTKIISTAGYRLSFEIWSKLTSGV